MSREAGSEDVGRRSAAGSVLEELRRRGETVATAESLTAGMVCVALTDVAGASRVVRGGVVVYATDLKEQLVGVPRAVLERCGAVHPEVAERLAEGVRQRCGADWGIGLTGVAGPSSQDGVQPGAVHLGFAGPEGASVRSEQFSGDRRDVRCAAVRAALEHFAALLR